MNYKEDIINQPNIVEPCDISKMVYDTLKDTNIKVNGSIGYGQSFYLAEDSA